MKLTYAQIKAIVFGCFNENKNGDIAELAGIPLHEVHAFRSRNNLTIAKVADLKANGVDPQEYVRNLRKQAVEYSSDNTEPCGCCGKAARIDDEYTLPDGEIVFLCENCIRYNDFLKEHGGA